MYIIPELTQKTNSGDYRGRARTHLLEYMYLERLRWNSTRDPIAEEKLTQLLNKHNFGYVLLSWKESIAENVLSLRAGCLSFLFLRNLSVQAQARPTNETF